MKEQTVPPSPLDWKSPAYQADDFFAWVANLKILRGQQVVQEIPNLEEVVAAYRERIQGLSPSLFVSDSQIFSIRIHLDPMGNYYDVSWDVERLKETVRKKKLKPFLVPVKEPTGEVDWDYAKQMENGEPILMVDYMPTKEVIIVDGNHRMAKRYMENPRGLIQGYILSPYDQSLCFCSDLYLHWFMVHHNINTMMNYILGNTRELLVGDSSKLRFASVPVQGFHDPRWLSFLFPIEPLPKVPIRRL